MAQKRKEPEMHGGHIHSAPYHTQKQSEYSYKNLFPLLAMGRGRQWQTNEDEQGKDDIFVV
jgi:hypothetical protein